MSNKGTKTSWARPFSDKVRRRLALTQKVKKIEDWRKSVAGHVLRGGGGMLEEGGQHWVESVVARYAPARKMGTR